MLSVPPAPPQGQTAACFPFPKPAHESQKSLSATRNQTTDGGFLVLVDPQLDRLTPHPPSHPLPGSPPIPGECHPASLRRHLIPPTYWCRGLVQHGFYGSRRQKTLNNYGRPASSNVAQTCSNTAQLSSRSRPPPTMRPRLSESRSALSERFRQEKEVPKSRKGLVFSLRFRAGYVRRPNEPFIKQCRSKSLNYTACWESITQACRMSGMVSTLTHHAN